MFDLLEATKRLAIAKHESWKYIAVNTVRSDATICCGSHPATAATTVLLAGAAYGALWTAGSWSYSGKPLNVKC